MSQRAGPPPPLASVGPLPGRAFIAHHPESQAQLLLFVKHSLGQQHLQPKAHEAQHSPSSEVKLTGRLVQHVHHSFCSDMAHCSIKDPQQLWLVPQTLQQPEGSEHASTLTVTLSLVPGQNADPNS